MKNLMKTAAVMAVLAMVVLGPAAAIAAPHQNPYKASPTGEKFGLIDVLMQILGIGSKAPVQTTKGGTGAPAPAPTTAPSAGGSTFTTDSAIWGGDGRCPTCP